MITGKTRLIAHLGVPTESFRSPMIHNPWFESRGIDTVVMPLGCEAEDFPAFLRHVLRLRNAAGALVTMPHKVTAAGLLDEASVTVKVCGACNAVKRDAGGRLVGDMFDGDGFTRGMQRKGHAVAGKSALVVGCGGVGSAIAAALAREGLARLGLHDERPDMAEGLAKRLARHYPALAITTGSADPEGHDIAVNATPLGMRDGDPLPFDPDRLTPSTYVGEVVLSREVTPLVAAARARGCMTQTGLDMLFEQIPAYLAFFGYPPATAEELRAVARLTP